MGEPVRLIIWDLDDTFWRGTLSEGGIQAYVQEHHDIVVALARRGIMNSICSKNDIAAVCSILQEKGLWDYFIFPSIDWSPKGSRIANLIETVQLRPASVLFIDDNPNNRAEAQAAVPGLRVADEKYVSNILQDPLCRGKNDATLTRLAQYKLLEARKTEERAAGEGNNSDFLRSCEIKVSIETQIEAHLDRAVELINRTNQLNFTKVRLPDDPALAKQELAAHIGQYFVQAGLVRVSDKYGDYGFCGFYSKHNDNNDIPGRLVHFCFSCRTLGMGVEHWLYEKLRRPPVKVQGDVLVDLQDKKNVNWINQSADPASAIEFPSDPDAIPEIRFHGGCDLSAVAHYFKLAGNVTCLESNYKKDEIFFVRKDFSCSLLNALEWNAQMQRDCLAVGYGEGDVRNGFLADALPGSLLVYSGWGDVDSPLYRHRELGFRIPCLIEILKTLNVTEMSAAEIGAYAEAKGWDAATRTHFHQTLDVLRQTYAYDGLPARDVIFDNMRGIFDRLPRDALLVVILPHEFRLEGGRLFPRERATTYNQILRSLAARYANVMLVDIADFIKDTGDKQEGADHFHRIVYYRLFQAIMTRAKPRLRALRKANTLPRGAKQLLMASRVDLQRLKDIITQHEGNSSNAYLDTIANKVTVGVGFNMDDPSAKAIFAQFGIPFDPVYNKQLALTRAQTDELLGYYINTAINALHSIFDTFDQISGDRQLALIDMMFNLGEPKFRGFRKMVAAIEAQDWARAAAEMRDSKWAKQVGLRATRDADAMRSGSYPSTVVPKNRIRA